MENIVIDDTIVETPGQSVIEATPDAATAAPAQPQAAVAAPVVEVAAATETPPPPEKKQISIPSNKVAEIRQKERERGRKLAMSDLGKKAKELGFETVEEMLALANEAKKANFAPPKPAEVKKEEPQQAEESPEDKYRKLRVQAAAAEKARKKLANELNAARVDGQLQIAALKAGVVDVDIAMYLLKKAYKGKKAEELGNFDPAVFFAGLKKTHPSLFQAEVRPATTGNGATKAAGPAAPTGAAAIKAEAEKRAVDHRKSSRADWLKYLRDNGIPDPSAEYAHGGD